MAIKVSTGLVNDLADRQSLGANLKDGKIYLFNGTKPANADTATTATVMAIITNESAAYVAETRATFLVTVSGSAGSLNTLTVGGIDILGGAVTISAVNAGADAIAAAINAKLSYPDFTATTTGSSGVVTITCPKGSGVDFNGLTVAHTETTSTITINGGSSTTIGGTGATAGVACVGGLQLTFPAIGGLIYNSGTWSGVGLAAGGVTWFRYCSDGADTGTTSSTVYRRIDGSLSSTGGAGDATLDNTNVAVGQTITVTSFAFGLA